MEEPNQTTIGDFFIVFYAKHNNPEMSFTIECVAGGLQGNNISSTEGI